MNHAISKLAKLYQHAVLNREQQMKVTGGLAIACSFSINGGPVSYGGLCASASMAECMQQAGAQASQLSTSIGARVDYNCSTMPPM